MPTHYTTLLANNFGKESIYNLILVHISIARKYITIWRCPYHININNRVYYLTILARTLFQDVYIAYAAQFPKLLHYSLKHQILSDIYSPEWKLQDISFETYLVWLKNVDNKEKSLGICIANERKIWDDKVRKIVQGVWEWEL